MAWVRRLDNSVGHRTHHETIGEPLVQEEGKKWNNVYHLRVDEVLISNRSRIQRPFDPREPSVVDVRNGLKVKVHCGAYRHKREHSHRVGNHTPLCATSRATEGIAPRIHTLRE